jgi:uncharacterized protein (DUF4415 family)
MVDDDNRRYYAAQLERMAGRGDYVPNCADAPEHSARQDPVHLRLDSDVPAWFRSQSRGHLSRMDAILRVHM